MAWPDIASEWCYLTCIRAQHQMTVLHPSTSWWCHQQWLHTHLPGMYLTLEPILYCCARSHWAEPLRDKLIWCLSVSKRTITIDQTGPRTTLVAHFIALRLVSFESIKPWADISSNLICLSCYWNKVCLWLFCPPKRAHTHKDSN